MFSTYSTQHHYRISSLLTANGQRKYLDAKERKHFLEIANLQSQKIKLLCHTLVYSGGRISEVLNLCGEHVLSHEEAVIIKTLKQRERLAFRQIPIPKTLTQELSSSVTDPGKPVFGWGRTWALHQVKLVMKAAGIGRTRATARALRHTFGVHAVLSGVPLHLIQRWLGHSHISMTTVHTEVVGQEERQIAERMWL